MTVRHLARLTAVSLLATFIGTAAFAQDEDANPPWPVPPAAAKVANPVKSTPEGLAASAKLFHDNCLSCHGETGAGDGPASGALPRHPANFTDKAVMGPQTDGEIYFKMTTGRPPMPPWGKKLSDAERWGLVNYLRSLAK